VFRKSPVENTGLHTCPDRLWRILPAIELFDAAAAPVSRLARDADALISDLSSRISFSNL